MITGHSPRPPLLRLICIDSRVILKHRCHIPSPMTTLLSMRRMPRFPSRSPRRPESARPSARPRLAIYADSSRPSAMN